MKQVNLQKNVATYWKIKHLKTARGTIKIPIILLFFYGFLNDEILCILNAKVIINNIASNDENKEI
jgi:hypothetical protein